MRGGVVVVILAAMVVVAFGLPPRNLTDPEVNPGCEECEEPWLIVTTGEGTNDTLHHLWGAKEALSFLVVTGTGGPNISVDWDALHNGTNRSITFQSQPSSVFGFVIPSLILYNDPKDDGAFKGQNESLRVPVSDFTWSAEVLPNSSHHVAVKLQTTHFQDTPLPNETRILMQVSAYGEDGRSSVLPHLLYTPNSAQLDLVLDHLMLNLTEEANSWKKTRWGMDVVVFSSENKVEGEDGDQGLKFHTQKSLDDEHTPGVFNLDQLTNAGAWAEGEGGGYLQWRPVSYLSSDRDIAKATVPNLNTSLPALVNLTEPLRKSLAYAVMGDNLTLSGVAVTSVISFGQYKDGFYAAEKYTTWTVAIGEGVPPKETFSTLVVVVISLGVVLPAAMFLVGCVVLAVRRWRHHGSSASILITPE
ncbi:Glycosylated lysosomal membrane protein [Portunus trituberculatus]|uniref:Glycosylated lysosomal membrane protein n=1 Tax=Portunus trituberculatus TaxID=210409 RepID=A0A5B7EYG3_PORTR|nr:Glycosylated lysosomal membrane protein [Portunus trituberculatus]